MHPGDSSIRLRHARPITVLTLLLLLVALAGCGEDITTTRIAGGSARNFLYHLQHGELEDAMTYWAPDFTPADARARTSAALTRLRGYETDVTKTDTTNNADGSTDVVLHGRVRPIGGAWKDDQEILRAHLITRGPGWRLTDFTLVCCQ
jgi:hypothetical protein